MGNNNNLGDFSVTSDAKRASITANKTQYTDLDLSLTANPFTKDISFLRDDRAITGAVRNLILTNFFERPFDALKGANLRGFLFEPADHITKSNIRRAIARVLGEHEPRVDVININIVDKPDDNAYQIGVKFLIKEINTQAEVEIQLRRLR